MRILAPFKAVPDSEFLSTARSASADAKWVINPFDAIAIEEALRWRERGDAAELVVVTIGAARVDEQIRVAFAMGADRATRVDDARALDPFAVARILAGVVRREGPDLVIMGKQAVDDDSNQVGQMLAGLLGWPQATFVSRVEFVDDRTRALCTRETDEGLQRIAVGLPGVITTDLRLNEPRYVSLPGLIRARKKPIEVVSCAELGLSVQPLTVTVHTEPPPQRPAGTRVDSVGELVRRLREEAKVL